MPFLYTFIRHPRENEPGSVTRYRPGLPIKAATLGDALTIAANYFSIRILPHDERDWFRIYGIPGAIGDYTVVGVIILRGTERICVNQDLSFPLLEGDRVTISVLAGKGQTPNPVLEQPAK
jgi:hypothetical protein